MAITAAAAALSPFYFDKKSFFGKKLKWRIIGLENVRNLKLKDDDHLKKAAQGLRAGVGVLGSALPNFACLYLPLNAVP